MKRIYYLLILLSFCFVFCSCENKIENENNKTENGNNTDSNNETNYADDVYLINQLNATFDIEVFIGGKSSKFTLIPLEATYFTTIEYTLYEGDKINEFPGDVEYRSFLNSIDSVNVFCLAQKHTYVKSDNKTFQLFGNYEVNEKGWIIKFDEAKRAQFGWGDNIEDILKGERYVDSVYLVNHLDKPINLEMHRNSLYSDYEEWYFDAGTQNFTLKPKFSMIFFALLISSIFSPIIGFDGATTPIVSPIFIFSGIIIKIHLSIFIIYFLTICVN